MPTFANWDLNEYTTVANVNFHISYLYHLLPNFVIFTNLMIYPALYLPPYAHLACDHST